MTKETDASDITAESIGTTDTERELSDDELEAVSGGVRSTLAATKSKLDAGLLLPAAPKICDGSV